MSLDRDRVTVTKLRSLGGTWTAIRRGFGYRYEGELRGDHYAVESFAHLSMREGDDEGYDVRWHIKKNGKNFGTTCSGFFGVRLALSGTD